MNIPKKFLLSSIIEEKKMDEQIREFVKQTYHEAIASFDIEHLAKILEQAGIDSTSPEVSALLRELDKEYGIY